MKLRLLRLSAVALGLLIQLSLSSQAQDQSDHDAIIAAAHDYAFGIANLDRARIERAFAMDQAQLKLVLVKDGEQSVFVIPIRELMERIWLKLPRSENHFVDVLDLHVVEGVYATAVINNNDQFFDQLSLFKINGQWKIVDKLAVPHPSLGPSTLDLEGIFGSQNGQEIGLIAKREPTADQ